MQKIIPNEHIKMANTLCQIFHFFNFETIKMNLHGIDNTICLIKSRFIYQKYKNISQKIS